MYELCYLATTVGLFGALTMLLTIDLLYFGMTLYTVALYDELRHMVGAITSNNSSIDKETRFLMFRECVIFHNNILEYVLILRSIINIYNIITCRFIKLGNTIFSPIIFVQFVYGMFVLVTNVFAASYVMGNLKIIL